MVFEKNDILLMTGDSVTDCGRSAAGESANNTIEGMGNGYVSLVKTYLNAFYPELGLRIINKGIGGNRTTDILNRMEQDHLSFKPDVISIMIGINDVWRRFDSPDTVQIDEKAYAENMEKILSKFNSVARKVFVISPFVLSDKESEMGIMARKYAAIAKAEAQKANAVYVDLWEVFGALLEKTSAKLYSGDTVHPTICGHAVMAKALIEVMLK